MPGAPCLPRASFPAPGGEAAPAHAAPARPAPTPPPAPLVGAKGRQAAVSHAAAAPCGGWQGPQLGPASWAPGPSSHTGPRAAAPRLVWRSAATASQAWPWARGPGRHSAPGSQAMRQVLPTALTSSEPTGPQPSRDKWGNRGPGAQLSGPVLSGRVRGGGGSGSRRRGHGLSQPQRRGSPAPFSASPGAQAGHTRGTPRPSPQTSSHRLPGPGKIQMWGGLGNTRSLRPPPPRPRPSQGSSSAPLELGCLTKGGLLDPEETPLERDDPAEPLGMAQESSVRGSGRAPAPLPQPHLPAPHKPPSRSQASQGNFYSSPGGREASAPQHPRLVPPPLSPVQPPAPYRRLPGPLLQADWRWEAERPSDHRTQWPDPCVRPLLRADPVPDNGPPPALRAEALLPPYLSLGTCCVSLPSESQPVVSQGSVLPHPRLPSPTPTPSRLTGPQSPWRPHL